MMRLKFKKNSLRIALLPVFLLLSLMAMTRTSLACDCVPASENESFRRADLVFEGEVVRIAEVDHRTVYTFAVNKALKGPVEREVIITGTGTNCDQHFWPEVIYRVYARRFDGKFISGQCSGNKTLKVKKSPG